MMSIGIYIIFIAVLGGYRRSRYWPSSQPALSLLKNPLWHFMGIFLGASVLVIDCGWTIGLLTAVCTYMALLSCTIFIMNCNRQIQFGALLIFHMICIIGLILHF